MSFSVKMTIDGKEIRYEDIYAHEVERAKTAMGVLHEVGGILCLNGSPISTEEMDNLSDSDVIRACNQSKRATGMDNILRMMKPMIEDGDRSWKEIAEKSAYKENLKSLFVEVELRGLKKKDITVLPKAFLGLSNEDLAFALHPEHYYFRKAIRKNGVEQYLVETLGEYKPFFAILETSFKSLLPGAWTPCELDPDTMRAALAELYLYDGRVPIKLFAMHQIKPKKGGVNIKLGLFVPEATPDEVLENHANHFCIEFHNACLLMNYLHDKGATSSDQWIYERTFENKYKKN